MSTLFTQCPGDTVQTGTGKVDPARKFKCTAVLDNLFYILCCTHVVVLNMNYEHGVVLSMNYEHVVVLNMNYEHVGIIKPLFLA